MATEKDQKSGCIEWKVMVPETCMRKPVAEQGPVHRIWRGLHGLVKKIWKIGVSDPRKVIHGIKVGLALTLVSLFYYVRPLYDGIGGAGIGAVITVAVVFEFTVGGTIYKAFNRVSATLLAGSLAIGIHFLADKSGETTEPIIRGAFVFLIALVASFVRLIPAVKRQYDYGMMSFIVTFAFVSVSGYRVGELLELAEHRCSTIALGSSICVIVCMLVNPIWAGVDLHLLTIRNMEKLASSLDGCVVVYFKEDRNLDGKEEWHQELQGYKCVLNSKASEDSLANLARWEPAHGRFGFKHPWQKYLKVAAAMRHCASCIEALHAYINSDNQIQASELLKKHLRLSFMRLSSQSSMVLKELANSMTKMTKSSNTDLLIKEMGLAMGELQLALRYLPNQVIPAPPPQPPSTTKVDTRKMQQKSESSTLPLLEVMPLITLASLLIEVSTRIVGVVDAANDLADDAFCKPVNKQTESCGSQEKEGMESSSINMRIHGLGVDNTDEGLMKSLSSS